MAFSYVVAGLLLLIRKKPATERGNNAIEGRWETFRFAQDDNFPGWHENPRGPIMIFTNQDR